VKYSFPDPDAPLAPEWKAPLAAVGRAVAVDRRCRFFDPDDFMIMGRAERRSPRPGIVLYKHIFTRRYLNLDDGGHAYRYIATKGAGRYVAHRSLDDALRALALYDLPWMKPGLELERRGLRWDGRWRLKRCLEAGTLDDVGGLDDGYDDWRDEPVRSWSSHGWHSSLDGAGPPDVPGGDRRDHLRVV